MKRNELKVTAFALALATLGYGSSASAALITEWSGDGNDVLVSGGTLQAVTPHAAWGDVSDNAGLPAGQADWISYANTGVGGIIAPNTADRTNTANATAHFQRAFDVSGSGLFNLWVLSDDTATVELTGPGGTTTIWSAFLGQIDPCAPGNTGVPVGCVEADMGIFSTVLAAGSYTLDIYAFQTNNDVFGSQYALQYDVPEPGTLSLLGLGLLGLSGIGRRRKNGTA